MKMSSIDANHRKQSDISSHFGVMLKGFMRRSRWASSTHLAQPGPNNYWFFTTSSGWEKQNMTIPAIGRIVNWPLMNADHRKSNANGFTLYDQLYQHL
ncbi:MAG: hypothetical protein KZQ88_17680 [Candidatus Thiodiazotropha sp. (ex Dulcina madagascariensis)]|nr:hypothetical protein [Candidatus Thiodiazotropha sp. (ex Dulcina madagascariensis)]MCU7926918.1 hypothetical protein [Candidatus Thiodiazotropha sp. (ex Dulcina madagascariensis)]